MESDKPKSKLWLLTGGLRALALAALVVLAIAERYLPPDPPPAGEFSASAVTSGRRFPITIDRVVDGDTIQVDVDLGYKHWLVDQHVRLAGIDCPEMPTAEGKAAAAFAVDWLAGRQCQLTDRGRDKYGRLLGEIRGADGGESLNDSLIQAGHAKVYQ